jgi:hypothetical protein
MQNMLNISKIKVKHDCGKCLKVRIESLKLEAAEKVPFGLLNE